MTHYFILFLIGVLVGFVLTCLADKRFPSVAGPIIGFVQRLL